MLGFYPKLERKFLTKFCSFGIKVTDKVFLEKENFITSEVCNKVRIGRVSRNSTESFANHLNSRLCRRFQIFRAKIKPLFNFFRVNFRKGIKNVFYWIILKKPYLIIILSKKNNKECFFNKINN